VEPEKVNIQEILVKEKTVAENLLKRMKKGTDIASLAKEYSERKWAAERGGEFGLFTENQYGPIGKEAFALKVGQYGGPIQVSNGYSIFKVTEKHASRPKTFDEVESTIRRDLETEKKKAAFEEVLTTLREQIDVEINEQILTMSVDAVPSSERDQS
jgi:parvulin-like peptidyl-prolyl isomerase